MFSVCESEGRCRGATFAGADMVGRWKVEFAFDCYATFREVAKEL